MHSIRARVGTAVFLVVISTSAVHARELTFEQRVRAQEAIERVYYAHQIGATKPFETAVPGRVLEEKVRTYLRQSAALERIWKTPVTARMLERELERMAARTRMPERLLELYAALGNDPFVVAECLARPVLVDRLTRNFFAFDPAIHAEAAAQAADLRAKLVSGEIDFRADHPQRFVATLVVGDPSAPKAATGMAEEIAVGQVRIETTAEEFRSRRRELPDRVGDVSRIREDREAFGIQIVTREGPQEVEVATYRIPKMPWDSWWAVESQRSPIVSIAISGPISLELPMASPKSSECGRSDSWDNGLLDDGPPARTDHIALWTGKEMIVWGGWDFRAGGASNSGHRYDPATDTWIEMSSIGAPRPAFRRQAVWTGREMIVWAGNCDDCSGRYDPGLDAWKRLSTDGAPPGGFPVWADTEMFVWAGGTVGGGRYDPETDTWKSVTSDGAPVTGGGSLTWTGRYAFVWDGGFTGPSGGRYELSSDTWLPVSTVGAPLGRHTAAWSGAEVLVWVGSCSSAGLQAGGRYDPNTDSWLPIPLSGSPYCGYLHESIWTGTELIVWGGADPLYPLRLGGRYNPATDSWNATNWRDAPPGRYSHSLVWTGTHMIAWGGQYGWNTGGRYDPASDSWTPVSSGSGPPSRDFSVSVWTGNRMIVWGGTALWDDWYWTPTVSTGGLYDPATDGWTPTSTTGAPSARAAHTAVWTGDRMVVWGGRDRFPSYAGYVRFQSGGLYDPIADAWADTATTQAPTGRFFHSAVWTGSEMVVWGGAIDLQTGGVYDPEADSWRSTSLDGAPTARTGHATVWTGEEMVIWGGSSADPGGRYDPDTDTWRPVSTVDAPSPTNQPAAIWTGTEMVVWGGGEANGGGRYDPRLDRWSAMSEDGMPEARYGPAAVWSGRVMIVWGGTVASGGRYDPRSDRWFPMTTEGAPPSRYQPSAIWTGEQMLVWAGSGAGGRYDPGSLDLDDDGICDEEDNCPDDPNPDQADADADGIGDVCDACPFDPENDVDGDGVCGDVDNCPTVPNAGQTDADGDAVGDACDPCTDTDGDGFGNPGYPANVCTLDNCPEVANPDQSDGDGDEVGTACDNCPFDPNADQLDTFGGTCGDACEPLDTLVRFEPRTLNKKSRGNFITADLVMRPGYDIHDVEPLEPIYLSVAGSPPIPDLERQVFNAKLRVRWDRGRAQDAAPVGESVEFRVSGMMNFGCQFRGSDFLRVIDEGREHRPTGAAADDYSTILADAIRGEVRSLGIDPSGSLGPVTCLPDFLSNSTFSWNPDSAVPPAGEVYFYLYRFCDDTAACSYGASSRGSERLPTSGDCPAP